MRDLTLALALLGRVTAIFCPYSLMANNLALQISIVAYPMEAPLGRLHFYELSSVLGTPERAVLFSALGNN